MKKIITSAYLFIMTLLAALGANDVLAQNTTTSSQNGTTTAFTQNWSSASNLNLPGQPGVIRTTEGGGLIAAIKTVINRALSMLALVALIVLLRGGRQMVSAAGDEGQYKKGFTILRQAAFGLIFIGVAWLLVSGIFYFINIVTA